jgi:hypothetical protein
MHKPQPVDISQTPLQGTLNGIPHIQNLTTISGEWYPIILEFEESKQLLLQPRSTVDWYFSTTSGGDYFTFRLGAALQAPVVTVSGSVIGWVSSNQDVVFELLTGR